RVSLTSSHDFQQLRLLGVLRPCAVLVLAPAASRPESALACRELCVLRLLGLALPQSAGDIDPDRLLRLPRDLSPARSTRSQAPARLLDRRQPWDSRLLQVRWVLRQGIRRPAGDA